MTPQAQVIEAYRELCDNCEGSKTSKTINGHPFEARTLDMNATHDSRYMLLSASQFMANNCGVVVDDALDGVEFKWQEFEPGTVQSRATGGRAKNECGKFDPQSPIFKRHSKVQKTELLHIDREVCNPHLIGSMFQDGQQGYPRYFSSSNSRLDIVGNTNFSSDLMVMDFKAMAKGIDTTLVWGNWTGTPTAGSLTNLKGTDSPHFDGVLKQMLNQASGSYYAAVDVTIPAVTGGGAYFISYNRQFSSSTTDSSVLTANINSLTRDISAVKPYSAQLINATTIRVVSNELESSAYGIGGLLLYYSPDGTVTGCTQPLSATSLQRPMPYSEQPVLFDYTAITDVNYLEYFKGVFKEIMIRKIERYNGNPPNLGREYMLVDPLIMNERLFAEIEAWKTIFNAGQYTSRIENLFPQQIPYEPFKGTGVWFHSYESNIIPLSNVKDMGLGQTKTWLGNDCETVKSKIELLLNVLILDYSLCSSNIKGHEFSKNLNAPYEPLNLPHMTPAVRQDATNFIDPQQDGDELSVRADIIVTANGADQDVRLIDRTLHPSTDAIASYEWTIHKSTAPTVVNPATQAADVTVTMTQADYDAITLAQLKITLAGGSTETLYISKDKFQV